MRKMVFLGLALGLAFTGSLMAQRGESEVTIDGKRIVIEYGRPSLQGRDMLSRLPVGGTWRMGMNTATTLNTEAALKFGDQTVPAGRYTLTAKRTAETSWNLVIAGDDSTIEVPLQADQPSEPVETFTINLESTGGSQGRFSMAWGTMAQHTDFTVE